MNNATRNKISFSNRRAWRRRKLEAKRKFSVAMLAPINVQRSFHGRR
jgi:hypothetical protein